MSKEQIKSNVLFADENEIISDVVQGMCDQNVSSVLITDKEKKIIGIVTERDIVRKFTLLDMQDKLDRQINTIMNRPVLFVDVKNIDEDVARLHKEKKLRHFPVLQGSDPSKKNIVGMISLSDLARRYMYGVEGDDKRKEESSHSLPLRIISADLEEYKRLNSIFASLGYKVKQIDSPKDFPINSNSAPGVILDLDGFNKNQLHDWLVAAKAYRGPIIMSCSNILIVSQFRRFLDKNRRVAIKPLDISFCDWWFNTQIITD
jgi:CBS domain-containing protein